MGATQQRSDTMTHDEIITADTKAIRIFRRELIRATADCRRGNLDRTADSCEKEARYCLAVLVSRDDNERRMIAHIHGEGRVAELLAMLP